MYASHSVFSFVVLLLGPSLGRRLDAKNKKKSFWFQSIIPHLGIDGVTNNDIEHMLHAMPWSGMVLVNH